MRKKLSYEEVYEFFKSKGLELLDKEYLGIKTKIHCVDLDGYNMSICYDSLKNNKGVRRFDKSNPYTIENIKLYIKLNRENVEFNDNQIYIGAHKKLMFRCLIHNKKFPMEWANFQSGQGCPSCRKNENKTYKEVYEEFRVRGYELLSDVYINSKTSMTCIDSDGYKLFVSYDRLKTYRMLSKFGNGNIHTSENVKLYVKLNRVNVELVDGQEWVGANDKLTFKCLVHNEEFPCGWGSFQNGSGCPICAIERISGENNYNWKGGITPLHNHLRSKIKAWKNKSFRKYNSKCDITGLKLDDSVIHHLHPFSETLKETMEILQLPIFQEINKYTEIELKHIEDLCLQLHYKYGLGVCLTEDIHKELHAYYGGTNIQINEQQYYDFKEYKLRQLNILKEVS